MLCGFYGKWYRSVAGSQKLFIACLLLDAGEVYSLCMGSWNFCTIFCGSPCNMQCSNATEIKSMYMHVCVMQTSEACADAARCMYNYACAGDSLKSRAFLTQLCCAGACALGTESACCSGETPDTHTYSVKVQSAHSVYN